MSLKLYAHPFSSYCQKVLIALYENDVAFDYLALGPDHPENGERLGALWPLGKFPIVEHDGRTVVEASVIIEYVGLRLPGPVELVPADASRAIEVRMLDRIFDNYVMTPLQRIVGDSMRAADERDGRGVSDAHGLLDTAYQWLDAHLAGRQWAAGEGFSMADCAAAPALFYADWVHEIGADLPNLAAYRRRLLERPSFARAVEEARPFRNLFPLGAPDRD